jgi:hypothetical protein
MANNMFNNLKQQLKDSPAAAAVPATGRARRGKSADPNYTQTSVYVQRETLKKVQVALVSEDFDFSNLVENLLRDWVEKR